MGLPARAPASRHIFNNIYYYCISPSINQINIYIYLNGPFIPKPYSCPINNPRIHNFIMMTNIHGRILSQNTPVYCSFMITKSSCRSPRSRIHSPSRSSPKTWKLWLTSISLHLSLNQLRPFCSYRSCSYMGGLYYRLNLYPTNRYKIPYCLLFSRAYRPFSGRNNI